MRTLTTRRPPISPLFPYTTLFRSYDGEVGPIDRSTLHRYRFPLQDSTIERAKELHDRSEEHTSELQSLRQLVCRLLLEKKNARFNVSHVAARNVRTHFRTAESSSG